MRVALGKVEGVQSVDVTLKRGVAHITLKDGNAVTLSQLRKTIKDAGYTSQAATITAAGQVRLEQERLLLDVTGTGATLVITKDQAATAAFDALRASAAGRAPLRVELSGTVPPAAHDSKAPDTLALRTFTPRR